MDSNLWTFLLQTTHFYFTCTSYILYVLTRCFEIMSFSNNIATDTAGKEFYGNKLYTMFNTANVLKALRNRCHKKCAQEVVIFVQLQYQTNIFLRSRPPTKKYSNTSWFLFILKEITCLIWNDVGADGSFLNNNNIVSLGMKNKTFLKGSLSDSININMHSKYHSQPVLCVS